MTSLYDDLPEIYGTGEILADEKHDWRKTKLKNEAVASSFESYDEYQNRYVRMMDCGAILKYAVSSQKVKRLIYARFCRDRMCPGCQKRKSLVVYHQVKEVCTEIKKDNPTFKYLLLTLTVPNVKADRLRDEIKHIHLSWNKLTKRLAFKKSVKGFFRSLEVTYNGERDDYHPHLHVLLCVPSNYFTKNYISRDCWLEMWQQVTKYPHITQVDVRTVKPNPKRPESSDISSSAAEVAKYATKQSNYICKLPGGDFIAVHSVVRQLAQSLARVKLHCFGGLMLEYSKRLQQKDVESEDVDLIHINDDASDIEAVMVEIYRWNIGFKNYICQVVL